MRPWFLNGRLRHGEGEQGQGGGAYHADDGWRRSARLARRLRGADSVHVSSQQGKGYLAATCVALGVALGACDEPATRLPPQAPAARVKPAVRDLSTVEIAQRTLRSVVAIQTPEGSGSGFFVAPDLVATCFHVVRGSSDVRVKAVGWSGRATGVAAWDEENDLAVLRVAPSTDGRGLKIDRGPYVVGSKVVVVSSPLGLDDTVSDGLISALRREPQDRLQFTAPISPGSSGGPIVNVHGEVMGMVASFQARVDRGMTIGQNLNFAVPASLIMIAMSTPNEASLESFAAQTVPPEEKKWREVEASLTTLDNSLPSSLGERVGKRYAAAIRRAVGARDGDAAKSLLDRTNALETERKNLLELVGVLERAGGQGPQIARDLVTAWEDYAIDTNDETKAHLAAAKQRMGAFAREVTQRARRPNMPDAFAGFAFMGAAPVISQYCLGYPLEALAGLKYLQCPTAPVPPPFTQGGAQLAFLNGSLVSVQMDVDSYQRAVAAITAKYGEPVTSTFKNGSWFVSEAASFSLNTSFNWTLNGGRIRVGRISARPFVAFIRDERDQAIDSSF